MEADSFSFMGELIAGFESEASELVESVTQNLLSVEKGGDAAALTKIYDKICRSLHTLKGSAATCGLAEVSDLSHRLEDVVVPYKSSGALLSSETVDLILTGLDILLNRVRVHVREKNPGAPDKAEWDSLLSGLESARKAAAANVPAAEVKKEQAHLEEEAVESLDLESGWKVNTQQVIRMMQEVERLRELKLRLSDESRRLNQGLKDRKFRGDAAGTADVEGFLLSLSNTLVFNAEETTHLVDSLEEHLKDISMLSFNTIAQPMHRQVRDLCRRFGKQADLSVAGGEILLDRRVLEGLKGPLVHLVRNALDHGLETPEKRDKAGKHREGALVIRVEQQGNLLFLEVSDDGQGIDLEKIRREALQRQMFSKEELSRMEDSQLRQLLFHSGFSTKGEVTSISGRGVGLDVVKTQIQAMKGTVEIQSKAGQGTRFIITLPVELGSSPIQIIRVGPHFFGLPLLSIQNIVRAHPEAMDLTRDRWTQEMEGRTMPLKDLGALLRTRLPKKPQSGQPLLLLMASEGQELALAVDEIIGDENLVLHPLPAEFSNVEAFQGAGLLPNGELMLILKTGWLSRLQERQDPFQDRLKAMVVVDSLTARAMHRNMLESGGYLVHGASSARQGLELLETSTYDVVLCDIGMEEMDGLAFTRLVRLDPKTRSLPIILVSAHDEEKDVQGYLKAGADAFLSKKDCNSGRLLAEVSKLLGAKGQKP
jgi:two-component system chemotaxis sensor kinase CheA